MKSIYIPAQGYKNVKTYKYAYDVTDRAITNTLLGWFWNLILTYLIPMWWSPNAITLLGLAILLCNFLATLFFVPTLTGYMPGWLILFNGFGVFMRQTLDAIDGKHARRTGASSALGEFLDHGLCDSLEIWFVGFMCCALGGIGVDYRFYCFLVVAMVSHYTEMWAIYLTGKLEFWYISFQESELLGVLAHIAVYFSGRDFLEEYHTQFGYTLQVKEWLWWGVVLQFATAAVSGLVRGTYYSLTKAQKDQPTFGLLAPLAWVITFTSLWLHQSPSLWVEPGRGIPIMVIFCALISFSNMRLVVGRVCRFDSSYWYYITLPLAFGWLNAIFGWVNETYYVWAYLVVVVFGQTHCAYVITTTLCNHLNVNLFVIVPKPPQVKQEAY